MFEIRPPLLESHGLGHAVGELLDQTRRDMGIQVAVTIDVARLPPSVESLELFSTGIISSWSRTRASTPARPGSRCR